LKRGLKILPFFKGELEGMHTITNGVIF